MGFLQHAAFCAFYVSLRAINALPQRAQEDAEIEWRSVGGIARSELQFARVGTQLGFTYKTLTNWNSRNLAAIAMLRHSSSLAINGDSEVQEAVRKLRRED
jgi:hypothetical protein